MGNHLENGAAPPDAQNGAPTGERTSPGRPLKPRPRRKSCHTDLESGHLSKKLDRLIGPRGELARAIEGAEWVANDHKQVRSRGLTGQFCTEVKRLCAKMQHDLRTLATRCKPASHKNVRSLLRRSLHGFDPMRHDDFDPVLMHTITSTLKLEKLSEGVKKEALAAYVRDYDEYVLILGELVSKTLRDEARLHVARRKYQAGTHATALEDWGVFVEHLHHRVDGPTTGLPSLDEALGGGLSDLTLIGADEGDGKTSLVLWMVVSALREDPTLDCLFYTLDQSKATTYGKLLHLATGFDRKTFHLPVEERPAEVQQQIEERHAMLCQDILPRTRFVEKANLPEGHVIDATTLLRDYENLRRKSPAERGMLVLDMFQSLDRFPPTTTMDNDKDDYRLEVIRQFRTKTRCDSCPEGFPVIATSEIRKMERVELTTNDLRGSARLGSIPSNILLLWPPANTDQLADVVPRAVKVAKSRYGEEGLLRMHFHHRISKFTEEPAAVKDSRGSGKRGQEPDAPPNLDPKNDI